MIKKDIDGIKNNLTKCNEWKNCSKKKFNSWKKVICLVVYKFKQSTGLVVSLFNLIIKTNSRKFN